MAISDGGEREALAPVIPLFGAEEDEDLDEPDDDGYDSRGEIEREIAEATLLKKLRTRSLSVQEARMVIAQRDLGPDTVEAVLCEFVRRGYLDDARLAEHLVRSGVERKRQGRHVLVRVLADRGIPRDVSDAAIADLPDDDAERALAFARSRASTLRGAPADAALRRLTGQLSRRGYGGAVALSAAKEALEEAAAR